MLAYALAAAAGACLVVGWWLEQIILVHIALGASALGLLLVLIAMWRRKRSDVPDPPEEGETSTATVIDEEGEPGDADEADEEPAPTREHARDVFVERMSGDRLELDDAVYVLQHRKRFHAADCRLVKGKDSQELTLLEAREEDFTACSVCLEVGAGALLSEQR